MVSVGKDLCNSVLVQKVWNSKALGSRWIFFPIEHGLVLCTWAFCPNAETSGTNQVYYKHLYISNFP